MTARPPRRPVTGPGGPGAWAASAGLAGRVLAGLLLVVATGGATAWLVASAVAPGLFHQHLMQAGMEQGTGGLHGVVLEHAEQAFASAGLVSLSVAVATATAVSLAVSLYLARRVARALRPLAVAAERVARGHPAVRVADPRLGPEVGALAAAFNAMAADLDRTETTRRRLLDDLGHELRTPVATLAAYLEALEDGVREADPATLAVMRDQTRRLARLAHDVAAVSRAEEGHDPLRLRAVPAADLLDAAAAAAAPAARTAGVALRVEVAPGTPPVLVDPDRLGQVLANLLDNALRHTPDGGHVLLHAAAGPPVAMPPGPAGGAGAGAGAGARAGVWVRLEVRDDGAGVPVEHLPHLFERFYRADAARARADGGSGIGLAVVRAVVQAHGGQAHVHSDGPGAGTTVTLDLPAAV